MQNLTALASVMPPAIEIDGFEPATTYRCDKCCNRHEKEVHHPKASFRVVNEDAWSKDLHGDPFLYLLTAVDGATKKEAPRYVGIGASRCLMRRWTRMPDSQRARFADGSLIHHLPVTISRLRRDFDDPVFGSCNGFFKLRVAPVRELVYRLTRAPSHAWVLPGTLPGTKPEAYSFVEEFEKQVIAEMYTVGLSPWNGTRGTESAPSSTVLAKGLVLSA